MEPKRNRKASENATANAVENASVATTPTPEETPTPTPEPEQEDASLSVTITRKVVGITTIKDDSKRLRITLDGEPFESITPDGTVVDTNSFGIDSRYLCELIGDDIEPLSYAYTAAMQQRINPVIIALCLKGATLKVTRTYRAAGEARKYGDEVYSSDVWTTDAISAKPKITAFMAGEILNLIRTALLAEEQKPKADSAETAAANWANV